MKLSVLLVLLVLAGCATRPSPEMRAYNEYRITQGPRAFRGEIKASEYFLGLYERATRANAPAYALIGFNDMIALSKRFEAGEISKDEFEHYRRATFAKIGEGDQAAAARAVEVNQRQQAIGAAQMAAGAQMIAASQPRPALPLPVPAPTIPTANYGGLQGQSINGQLKYCRYSNGVVTTISSWANCPYSNP